MIKEFGTDGTLTAVESLESSEAREMLGEFLEFNARVEQARGNCAGVEVFRAVLSII